MWPAGSEELDVSDPLAGAGLVARWGLVYDEPEERGGGYVAGEFLLRSDGVLLRLVVRLQGIQDPTS